MITKTFFKGLIVVMMCLATIFAFAAIGGKGKKGAKTATNGLSKLSITKISLRSNYEFKGNKLVSLTPKKDFTTLQQYTTFQKGNKTVVIASKHNVLKPVVTYTNNNIVSVKLIKLKLN